MSRRKPSLDSLMQSRTTVRAQLNRITEYVKAFSVGDNVQQIISRNERIVKIWEKYEETQSKLEAVDFEMFREDRNSFEDEYYNTSSEMKRIIEQNNVVNITQETRSLDGSITSQQQQNEISNRSKINLPKITLPQFNGEYKDWRSFYDLFKAVIHENSAISNIEKLFYLKSSLTGEALKIIESIPSTSDNYETAFKLLVDRYDNNQVIINTHLNNLFSLNPIIKQSASTLRSLITDSKQQIESLKALKLPVEHWDVILIHLLTQKLDFASRREWELRKTKDKLPNLDDFFSFLETRCLSLEALEPATHTHNKTTQPFNKSKFKNTQIVTLATNQALPKCPVCQGSHKIYKCDKFLSFDVKKRVEAVKTARVCFNCLNLGHAVKQCNAGHCKKCDKAHNTLLHFETVVSREEDISPSAAPQAIDQETVSHTVLSSSVNQILLSTAVVRVRSKSGTWIECRALLDSGSQSNCVTEKLINQLNLEKKEHNSNIIGINGRNTLVTKSTKLTISSRVTSYQINLECLVLDKITADLPNSPIDVSNWKIPKDISLADPTFNEPKQIDLLLGAEIYFNILKMEQRRFGDNFPIIQNSLFGWILAGTVTATGTQSVSSYTCCSFLQTTDQLLTKFWELENYPIKAIKSREENECEEHFENTIKRDETERYIAQLPVRADKLKMIGNSRELAELRLQYLWHKLSMNPELKIQYVEFMQQYLNLNHMERSDKPYDYNNLNYFIPHHAVMKQTNHGAKIRVVFDASMKSDTGVSLNDALKVGPVVQQDLISIVMRFRLPKYAFTSDIEKMYRQILIDEEQRKYQLILWKNKLGDEVEVYKLRTVTYGTASAPYIATKCLQHLASNDGNQYPLAQAVLLDNCYVDDIMTGANTLEEAKQVQTELIDILNKGGFTLHKWCANHNDLLTHIATCKRETREPLEIGNEPIKTLGLLWLPSKDKFKFAINLKEIKASTIITKRLILSDIAGIFDPLGLLGPVVIKAKIFLQQLWKLKIPWDREIPENLASEWLTYRNSLQLLEQYEVNRRLVEVEAQELQYEIHGFGDASQLAYGACLYLKATNNRNEVSLNLITAKSKVAPVKPVTIPRLELCAALTLARLTDKVVTSLQLNKVSIHLWTDSTIVLNWISSEPNQYKTFVANRIVEIQELTKNATWHHVSTTQNPADYISRGATPSELQRAELWWKAPAWLSLNDAEWPLTSKVQIKNEDNELKTTKIVSVVCTETWNLFCKYSSLSKLQRVTAYLKRFIYNCKNPKQKIIDPLSVTELQTALLCLIKIAQHECFNEEIELLRKDNEITSGCLKSLTPFLDNQNILRVQGRLQNSEREYEHKHPIILPKDHSITMLIIREEHERLLHAGTQAVLTSIRRQYWPIHGRSVTRKIIHQCMKCYRHRATPCSQLMGNLPSCRTQPFRAFLNVGVDYGGPIYIKSGSRRNSPRIKTYIALFVCLSTRAIHVELVVNLSTKAFLNAFKRFVSRRGLCKSIFSDNATNFKCASREMKELYELFQDEQNKNDIINHAATLGIEWKFIPPSSPHQGGIWEAGIKAIKYHLKRVIGTHTLTFEETYTILTQIEACVNSRPLCQITDDPTDLTIITPSHFLIGCPLTAMPEPDLTQIAETKLSKWQRMQSSVQVFWRRWSQDYLNTLQQRSKWTSTTPNLKPDEIVLVKEDNQPPLHWPLARVKEVHPGTDGRVRVVTIRTATGTYKRPITKLCRLPIND